MKPLTSCRVTTGFSLSVAVALLTLTAVQAKAQTPQPSPSGCLTDNTSLEGLPLHSLKIKVRGGWTPQLAPPSSTEPILVVGEPYTAKKRTFTIRAVNKALLDDRRGVDETIIGAIAAQAETKSPGVISVLFIDDCPRIVEGPECGGGAAKCVNEEIRPYYLRLEKTKIGKLVLPIPRSNRPTFFKQAPRPLLAFNPTFGTNYDRRYGFSERAGIYTNLLDLPQLLSDSDALPVERNTKLNLQLGGQKSLNKPFYEADASLSFKHRRPDKMLEFFSFDGSFTGSRQPWGNGNYFQNVGKVGATLEFHPGLIWLGRITAGGSYRFSDNRFFSGDGLLTELTREHAFEGRVILDGRLLGGLARLGLWADANSPNKNFKAYQRVAGIFGYQKEFPVALNQTIGVEALVGAGSVSGNAPEYARFYGGNELTSFLYNQTDDHSLVSLPSGPLLRSFGNNQAGEKVGTRAIRGATSYSHFNLNITIPIPGLSRPLIPAEQVIDDDDDGGGGGTLKDVIKGQMNTAESSIEVALEDEGMSPAAAQKEAVQIVKEIKPAVNFIADQANIFSIKPLLMFDAANLRVPGSADDRTRYGIGGGLQLTIVVAKFEVGYMRAVRRSENEPKGNFVFRLVFQNLF